AARIARVEKQRSDGRDRPRDVANPNRAAIGYGGCKRWPDRPFVQNALQAEGELRMSRPGGGVAEAGGPLVDDHVRILSAGHRGPRQWREIGRSGSSEPPGSDASRLNARVTARDVRVYGIVYRSCIEALRQSDLSGRRTTAVRRSLHERVLCL